MNKYYFNLLESILTEGKDPVCPESGKGYKDTSTGELEENTKLYREDIRTLFEGYLLYQVEEGKIDEGIFSSLKRGFYSGMGKLSSLAGNQGLAKSFQGKADTVHDRDLKDKKISVVGAYKTQAMADKVRAANKKANQKVMRRVNTANNVANAAEIAKSLGNERGTPVRGPERSEGPQVDSSAPKSPRARRGIPKRKNASIMVQGVAGTGPVRDPNAPR